MADEFSLKMPDFHVTFRDRLRAINLRHGTNGFTSIPKEGVLRIFFALKNPTPSAGFEPANLGTKGQYATSRPLKPLNSLLNQERCYKLLLIIVIHCVCKLRTLSFMCGVCVCPLEHFI